MHVNRRNCSIGRPHRHTVAGCSRLTQLIILYIIVYQTVCGCAYFIYIYNVLYTYRNIQLRKNTTRLHQTSDRRGARIYIGIPLSGGAIVRRSTRDRAGDDDDEKKKLERRFFVLYEPRMCVCVCILYTVYTVYLRVVGSPFRLYSPRTSYRLGPREKLSRAHI